MKILDLFSGSGSVKQAFKDDKTIKIYSIDITPFENIDLSIDILKFFEHKDKIPFIPDIIIATPPCTSFSIAGVWHHWVNFQPISRAAQIGYDLVSITKAIIQHYQQLNSKLIYFIENPRSILRKFDIMKTFDIRSTITQCSYGREFRKPTDIWHNNNLWFPRIMCSNNDTCHQSSPRGSFNKGIQGLKNDYERSKIPHSLYREFVYSINLKQNNWQLLSPFDPTTHISNHIGAYSK
jgi:hypothetical protein